MGTTAFGRQLLQPSLPGFDAPPGPTDRLFFALYPSTPAAMQVERLAQQERTIRGLKGRPLRAEHFHITLHHLGDFVGLPQHIVAMALEAGAAMDMPQFEVTLNRVGSFDTKRGNNPYVLLGGNGVRSLTVFQQALGVAMAKTGLRPPKTQSSFTPHLTLLYDAQRVDEHATEAVNWTAREFVLVHSVLGETKHIPLARWPLRATAVSGL